jgi:hypothetical protein
MLIPEASADADGRIDVEIQSTTAQTWGATNVSNKPERRQRIVHHRDMKKFLLSVLTGLIVLVGVAGCSSTTRPSVAEVTGFQSASVPAEGSAPSGPVTVRVAGKDASRLARLVSELPSVRQSQVQCEEAPGLIYRIVFGAGSVAQSKEIVEGYWCAAAVTVAVAGKALSWRRDVNCTLIRAVRHVLPDRAKATQRLLPGCGS